MAAVGRLLAAVCLCAAQRAAAETRDFLRRVSAREVEADLQATLSSLFGGSSAAAHQRLAGIEASTWPTFQALPKNNLGRLAPAAVRYLVHGYFAREHGWLIKGLEPHGMQLNTSELHDVDILQDRAPLLVEGLLEARNADRGLAFNDVVTMVAALEQMMFDESVTLVEAAYRLNGWSIEEKINQATLHRVLQSYLLLFGQGAKANLWDVDRHHALLASRKRPEIEEFELDTVLNFEYARRHRTNPFRPRLYSFQATVEIMEDLAQQYGKWQNSECRDMKAHLVELDPEGLGRVPLGLFYAQPQGSTYHFSESAEYLRKIGALDEASPTNPNVFIANYIAGPSNCIASSSYYSVCCLSECAEVFGELERIVAAPQATPEKLMEVVAGLSDAALPHGLPEKLQAIAARHGGEVPLHGRLFAQWLHFAFPHECPFPSILESADVLAATHWLDGRSVASSGERQLHAASASALAVENIDIDGRWSDQEVLPVLGQPRPLWFEAGSGLLRGVVQLVAFGLVVRSALNAWREATALGDAAAKKDDEFALRV